MEVVNTSYSLPFVLILSFVEYHTFIDIQSKEWNRDINCMKRPSKGHNKEYISLEFEMNLMDWPVISDVAVDSTGSDVRIVWAPQSSSPWKWTWELPECESHENLYIFKGYCAAIKCSNTFLLRNEYTWLIWEIRMYSLQRRRGFGDPRAKWGSWTGS